MSDGYSFDEQIQVKILSLLRANLLTEDQVQPAFFENIILAAFCEALLKLNTALVHPSEELVLHEVHQNLGSLADEDFSKDIPRFCKGVFTDLPESHVEYVKGIASEFAEFMLYKRAILASMDDLRTGNGHALVRLKDRWKNVINTSFTADTDLGKMYFSDYGNRISQRLERVDTLRTLIPELDSCLDNGGVGRGEMTLCAGRTGTGKSFFLTHMARVALIQRKKVVFYSCEMSYEKLCNRLDASFTGLLSNELKANAVRLEEKLKRAYEHFGDSFVIKRYLSGRTTVSGIRRHIEQLHRTGFVPDVVIVDYMNILAGEQGSSGARHEVMNQTYVDLRGVFQEYDVFGVTAAQGNRSSANADLFTLGELAHCYDGSGHADTIITLNMTRDEEQRQLMRLYILKNRYNVGSTVALITTDFARGNLYKRVSRHG